MPTGIIYPINPVMERSDLAGAWPGMQTMRLRGLPSGIIYLISPVMTRSGLAGALPGIGRVRHPLTLP